MGLLELFLETENIGWMGWFLGLLTLFGLPILDYPLPSTTATTTPTQRYNITFYRPDMPETLTAIDFAPHLACSILPMHLPVLGCARMWYPVPTCTAWHVVSGIRFRCYPIESDSIQGILGSILPPFQMVWTVNSG